MITVSKAYVLKYSKIDKKTGELRAVQEQLPTEEKALKRRAELEEQGFKVDGWKFETIDCHETTTFEKRL